MHSLLCALSAPSFFLGQTDRDVVARIISGILCLLVVCLGIRLGFNGGSLEVILYKTTELLYFILNAGVCYLCHSISQVGRSVDKWYRTRPLAMKRFPALPILLLLSDDDAHCTMSAGKHSQPQDHRPHVHSLVFGGNLSAEYHQAGLCGVVADVILHALSLSAGVQTAVYGRTDGGDPGEAAGEWLMGLGTGSSVEIRLGTSWPVFYSLAVVQGLIWIESMLASMSVFIFLADTLLHLNVWFLKASLVALMHLKITLFIVSLPKGGSEPQGAGKMQSDYLRYLENSA